MNKKQKNLKEKFKGKTTKKTFYQKYKNFLEYKKIKQVEALKKKTPKSTLYLHRNKNLKQGLFLKKPCFNTVNYPFYLNLKLVHESITKK